MILRYKKTASILSAVFLLGLDRFFKILALNFYGQDSYELWGDIIRFTLVKNYFISLSLPFSGYPVMIVSAVVIAGLTVYIFRQYNYLRPIPFLGLILLWAGAVSNLYDRLAYGFVIDYFDFKYLFANNLADKMIFAGVFLLVFFCREDEPERPPKH